MSDCLSKIGLSPLKFHSQPSCSKIQQRKRRIDAAIATIKEKVSKSLDVPLHRLEPREETVMHDTIKKAEEFDHLMLSWKEKIAALNTNRLKIQALSLILQGWPRRQAANFLGVSEYLVRTAKSLALEKGILSLPDPK